MKLCDYQILEYATSELQEHGVPFVVVVQLHELSSYTLKTFILRQWKARIAAASKGEVEEIEIFLEDLRLQSGEPGGIASLFERLAGLNVGPIRAFVSGSCSEQGLNEVIPEFFDQARGSLSWKEHFISVI